MIADIRVSNVDKKSADGETAVRLCNYTDVYYREQITDDVDFMTATAPESQIRRFRLEPGDVLITKDSESWDDIAVPAVVTEPVDAVCGYHLAQLRPKPDALNGRYLFYAMKSPGPVAHFKVRANGVTRFAIGTTAIGDTPIPLPPPPAQRSIATYLDSETSRIDSLIDRKQRFIELLLEKRTALITHAVTKGLDPSVEMKDSGAPWLGSVPSHWDVKANKRLLRLHQRAVGEKAASYTLLSLTLQGLVRRDMDSAMGKWPSSFDTYQVVRRGELVFCLFDVDETPRTVGLAQETGMVTGAYTVAETADDVEAEYIYYLFVSFDSDKRLKPLYSGLRKVIRPDRFLHAKMPFPPHEEQKVIVAYLNSQTAKIDALVDKTRRSIELLKEYRTALISAAVTGQIEIPATGSGEDVA